MKPVRLPNAGKVKGKRTDHNPTAPGLLAANKISYKGCYRFPLNDTITAYGGMAGRKVAGKVRLFAHASKDTYGAKGTVTAVASNSEFTANMFFESIYGEIAIGTTVEIYDPTVETALPQVRTVTNVTPVFAGSGSYTYTLDSPVTGTLATGWIFFKTDDPIMEFELPDHALNPPTSSYATAPRATRIAYWPDPYRGRRHTYREDLPANPGVWSHDQDSNAPNHYFPVNLYWHEDFQALYMTYISTYTVTGPPDWGLCAAQLGAPSTLGGSDGTVVAGGPWRTEHTDRYNHTWYGPGRMGIISRKHNSANMIGAGVTRSGVHSNSWGPSLWGAAAFPEIGVTPDGFSAADIPAHDRYLEYYYPSIGSDSAVNDGNYINKDGTFEGTLATYVHKKPTGYSHIFEPDYDTPRNMVDPAQNGGFATWTPADAVSGILWFDDGVQKAVIFTGTFALSAILDEEDEDAAHVFYRNEHEYSLHYNPGSLVGSFTQGEVITGLSSGSTLNAGNISHSAALNKVQGGHTPADVQNWTIGETLQGGSSGATATLTIAHRHNWCNHGFTEIVTGDFSTHSIPVIALYDPARLETNKTESTLDYTTEPYEVIDVEAEFGIDVSENPAGVYKSFAHGWYDEETRNWYCISLQADLTLGESGAASLIHVLHIDE